MAWTYHDFEEQTDDSARLTRLRQHITEVNQKIQSNMRTEAGEKENTHLVAYLRHLDGRRAQLEARVGTVGRSDPRVRSGFTRGRPV